MFEASVTGSLAELYLAELCLAERSLVKVRQCGAGRGGAGHGGAKADLGGLKHVGEGRRRRAVLSNISCCLVQHRLFVPKIVVGPEFAIGQW